MLLRQRDLVNNQSFNRHLIGIVDSSLESATHWTREPGSKLGLMHHQAEAPFWQKFKSF